MKRLKRFKKTCMILIGILCITGSSYLIYQDMFGDPYIPQRYIDCEEHYDPNCFMDWSDFCWYQYNPADRVDLLPTYQQVLPQDIDSIKGYFNNTRSWLETCNRLDEYQFDPACIDEGDVWLLFEDEGSYERYHNYQLYFFDKQSSRLYYLNNNV